MTDTTLTPESLEYRTEVKQLLDILAHSLYTDREIFLRELISNASDALHRVQFEMLTNANVVDPDRELAIWIRPDPQAKTLTITDSGIGMNRDELVENLGTIAHSGARAFLQNANADKQALAEIIGQFGVGFYSVFMVAQEVTVTSRSYRPEDRAWRWRSRGDSSFTLEPADQEERGTTIEIRLKEDATEFAQTWRLEQIIKKHSDYVSFPIYLIQPGSDGDEAKAEVINSRTALWRQSPSTVEEEAYHDFYKQLTYDTEPPLLKVHLVADAPASLRAILFVPSRRDRAVLAMRPDLGLRLYSRKILIQERNRDLLPDYFRFVEGVVDSDDLPLNVSREMVQSNPILRQLRRALSSRLIRELKAMAENEPEKYLTFWQEFGIFLKEGVATDPTSHENLLDLLRFRSTKSGDGWISFQEYVDRMQAEQKVIYYVLGDNLQAAARSPHLDYFRAHDIEVLYLVDPIDGFMTTMLREYKGHPLQNVDDAGLELPKGKDAEAEESGLDQEAFNRLMDRFKTVLGERIRDVRESRQLVQSPCRLVSPEDSLDRDLQRIRRLTEEDYEVPKKFLELNRRHPLIVNLAQILQKQPEEPVIDATIEQLFANALLLEGLHTNPVEMVERIQNFMEMAVAARTPAD